MTSHEFTAGFLFCGLGAGARGFLDAQAKLGRGTARFRSVGGVDLDREACKDFERLTGSPALVADIAKLQPHELRAAWGETSPDVVFLSAPCKGFSSLLSKKAASQQKYQELNRLALQGLWLLCETWPENPPGMLIFENVPRIQTRGAELLAQIRQVLTRYRYRLHEDSHDCGEIGNLAQHRRRYLMVARRPDRVREFVYQPPIQRVRGVGEVLGPLPLPGDPAGGPLHKVPNLKWVNWVRLALIRAGGDWRDLPKAGQEIDLTGFDAAFEKIAMQAWPGKHPGKFGVREWEQPARVVTGETDIQEGAQSVADPRIPLDHDPRRSARSVGGWDDPALTVRGAARQDNGAAVVADPRVPVGIGDPTRGGACGVIDWEQPGPTVTGQVSASRSNTPGNVADPRIPIGQTAEGAATFAGRPGLMGVNDWTEPLPTVTGTATVSSSNAVAAVADPRLISPVQPGEQAREHFRRHGVLGWDEPASVVAGSGSNGAGGVADPRIPLKCTCRSGSYGVVADSQPSDAVTGSMQIDNGRAALADGRIVSTLNGTRYLVMSLRKAIALLGENWKPPKGVIPVIVSADGTWHRPLTTLELAVLQGIAHVLHGEPLTLTATTDAKRREHVGNAVPVGAAQAIATSMLAALLASAMGWFLAPDGITWVAPETESEREVSPW